jgi:oligopeptide/dipeptide ABC transporter ATP-binding protein
MTITTVKTGNRYSTLEVDGITVEHHTEHGWIPVITDVSLTVARGETVALVGESGSGKSVTSRAILGLTELGGGQITHGTVRLDGKDIFAVGRHRLRNVRGGGIGMIFQEPRKSLDPAFTVGDQIVEGIRRHTNLKGRAARNRAIELLERVDIKEPAQRFHDYPHMFSGGMCQRVMIAMALAGEPSFLLADEPTTALDVTVQAQVMALIKEIQRENDLGVLLVSHDLGVVAAESDRIAVMYAGEIVEQGSTLDVLRNATHPYTKALIAVIPDINATYKEPFSSIRGRVPAPQEWPCGCRFSPRCEFAELRCQKPIPLHSLEGDDRRCRCILVPASGKDA